MVPKQLLLLVVALLFSTNVSAHDYKIKKGDTLKELSKRFDITVVDRKSTRLNSSHSQQSRMPSSA